MSIEENLSPHLRKALDELKLLGIVDGTLVERSVKLNNGQSLTGTLPDGNSWKLIRESADSFRIETRG